MYGNERGTEQDMNSWASGEELGREAEGRSGSLWGLETIMVPLTYVRSLVDGVTSLASAYYHIGEDKVTITRNVSRHVSASRSHVPLLDDDLVL